MRRSKQQLSRGLGIYRTGKEVCMTRRRWRRLLGVKEPVGCRVSFRPRGKKAAHATARPPASWHMRLHLIVMAAASSAALSYPQTKWDLRDSVTAALLVCRATNYLKSWPVSTGVEAVKPGNDLPSRPRLFVRTRARRWSLPSVASVLYGIVETCP